MDIRNEMKYVSIQLPTTKISGNINRDVVLSIWFNLDIVLNSALTVETEMVKTRPL